MRGLGQEARCRAAGPQVIDWHDFVIVETINFDDGEDADLPPPLALRDVIAMNKSREALEAMRLQETQAAAASKVRRGAVRMRLGLMGLGWVGVAARGEGCPCVHTVRAERLGVRELPG